MADPAPIRLSLADQALINVCGALVAQSPVYPDDEALYFALLAEVLPHVTHGWQVLGDVAAAARAVVAAAPARATPGGETAIWQAKMGLRSPLEAVFRWRAGLALDAWRAQVTEAA